jgi:uncharacterized protein YutE (UPF0331/DUF86 family)
MPLYDQERMVRLVSEHRKSISRLQDLSNVGREIFLSDPDKIGSAKYHFIVAIETCIDMCNHVISRNGYRVPEDYGDTFKVLEEVGAFGRDFAEELRNMARFRNRLVHLYWEVDDVQLYDILQGRLSDFKKFLDAISEFLGWQNLERS